MPKGSGKNKCKRKRYNEEEKDKEMIQIIHPGFFEVQYSTNQKSVEGAS